MEIKINGKINRVFGTVTFEDLTKTMKKKHLCSSCGIVACIGGRNLKNKAIKNAIKSYNGVYVLDCDDYIKEDKKKTNVKKDEQIYFSSPQECSVVHPTVKHILLR